MRSLLACGLFMALIILWFAGSAMAGDTIELFHNRRPECLLFRGIDCPEKGTDNLRADCSRPEV
jgi:hypothetical protein